MGHSVHNVDISKALAHRTSYILSVICLVQLKLGFILEEHTSTACRCAFAHWRLLQCLTAVRSRPWWGRRARIWASLRFCLCNSLCRNHPAGEEAGCGGPVVTHGLRLWGRLDILPNSLKCRWRTAYGREINIQFSGNSSGGHSCSKAYKLHTAWKLETYVALCCDKTAHCTGLLLPSAQGAPV